MAYRTLSLLLAVALCLAVGADAQCNLTVQDQPQYQTSCPGDNYTCVPSRVADIQYHRSCVLAPEAAAARFGLRVLLAGHSSHASV